MLGLGSQKSGLEGASGIRGLAAPSSLGRGPMGCLTAQLGPARRCPFVVDKQPACGRLVRTEAGPVAWGPEAEGRKLHKGHTRLVEGGGGARWRPVCVCVCDHREGLALHRGRWEPRCEAGYWHLMGLCQDGGTRA